MFKVLCSKFYAQCFMFKVLCSKFYVQSFMLNVLCSMFYVQCLTVNRLPESRNPFIYISVVIYPGSVVIYPSFVVIYPSSWFLYLYIRRTFCCFSYKKRFLKQFNNKGKAIVSHYFFKNSNIFSRKAYSYFACACSLNTCVRLLFAWKSS